MRGTLRVLRPDGILFDILADDGPEAAQHFHLGIAHDVGIERVGWLHRDETEQLQQVILNHVPQGAGFFIITGPRPDAFRFADGNLDVVDIFVVPDRLENAVGEPDDHEVLDGLFAQIMIDPENLRLVEDLAGDFIDLLRGSQITSDRLFDDDPGIGRRQLAGGVARPDLANPSQTEAKELGGILR